MIAFKQLCQRCGWRRFAIWLGFVTLAVLMGISERATSQVSGEKPYPFALAVRRSIEEWGLWGLVGLAVIWFARRQPLQEGRLGRWLALHAAGSIVVAVSYVVVYAAMMHGQTSVDGTVLLFPKFVVKLLVWHSQFCLLIYWMIVVADHAIVSYRNFREGERRAAELQAQLVEARLDALRMQINPHFLFNTLHTISALIHEKPEVADRMLVRLSELLRLTLERNDSHQVPLAQELGFLER
ncbi:MAG TPA: histidine kinase, partial [Verrucomicrobiae bacterium]